MHITRRAVLIAILSSLFCFYSGIAQAQEASVTGRVLHQEHHTPLADIQVRMVHTPALAYTDGNGRFIFDHIPYGEHMLVVGGNYAGKDTLRFTVDRERVELGDVSFNPGAGAVSMPGQQIPTVALEDNDAWEGDEDGAQGQMVSSLLMASRDPFLNTVAFVFGQYRFQPRGYNRNLQQVFINDVPVNDMETGNAFWNQWGGLNDVFRSRTQTYGLMPSPEAFGDINGMISFDATALDQQKQTRVTYSLANRQYRNRLMVTHSSGMKKGGWAYSLSASRRWAKEGYVEGTFYDGYSYYAGVSKLHKNHQFSLTTFGAPTRRGTSTSSIQEIYELAGTNFYNPNWGYQNGEKRNARVSDNFQPVSILNHRYSKNENFAIYTSAAYQFGKSRYSGLDWYNSRNPRPEYYRNLPSWMISEFNDSEAADDIREKWRTEPEKYAQIDWDRMYEVNYANVETVHDADGIAGNTVQGRRSLYVLGEDVDDIRKWTFNTRVEKKFGDRFSLFGGAAFIQQQTESYKEIADLLGGDFYLNLNPFTLRSDIPSASIGYYDLNTANKLLREGDKYNYHYRSYITKSWLWVQGIYKIRQFDFFLSVRGGYDAFQRQGIFQNGLFPEESHGRSPRYDFMSYGMKGGVTYKMNGRNYFFLNAGINTDAPQLEKTFIAIRTRNTVLDEPKLQMSKSVEGGYLLRSPSYSARVGGYVTDITNAVDVKRFYNDNPAYQSFGNYFMRGVAMRFIGTELAVEAKLTSALAATAVAALGQAFYTANPSVSMYLDNDTLAVTEYPEVYMKNHYVAAGPQSAYSLGLNYRSPKYWYANIRFNYFERNYISINPDRRTAQVAERAGHGSPAFHQIFDQEKLPGAFTADIFFGKSFLLTKALRKLPRNTMLYLNAGVNNLLNNKNIRTGGFEQLRYNFQDNSTLTFPPRYFYSFGANYFISASIKF